MTQVPGHYMGCFIRKPYVYKQPVNIFGKQGLALTRGPQYDAGACIVSQASETLE